MFDKVEGKGGLGSIFTLLRGLCELADDSSTYYNFVLELEKRLLVSGGGLRSVGSLRVSEFTSLVGEDVSLKEFYTFSVMVLLLSDGIPPAKMVSTAKMYGVAIGAWSPELKIIERMAYGRRFAFRLSFYARWHGNEGIVDEINNRGWLGFGRSVLSWIGLREEPAQSARFLRLETSAPDTLGYALYRFYRDNGFAFPGEAKGFPESGIYHDLCHILSGNGVDYPGELGVMGFKMGFMRKNPLMPLLFALLEYGAGVHVAPTSVVSPATRLFRDRDCAAQFLTSIDVGSQVGEDLTAAWDFWPSLERTVEEVRRALSIVSLDTLNSVS